MHWYVGVLKKYVTFSGRARRMEFWVFVLISFVISLILGFIDNLTGTTPTMDVGGSSMSYGTGLLGGLYGLAVLLPSLAVQVRRLHDTNRSGWWILIGLIPLVGAIILIVFSFLPGDEGPNNHGEDPKAVGAAETPAAPA